MKLSTGVALVALLAAATPALAADQALIDAAKKIGRAHV